MPRDQINVTHDNTGAPSGQGMGWDPWREDRQALLMRGVPTFHSFQRQIEDADWPRPAEIDPRQWFDVHNQGNVGSCQGQSLADAIEYCHWLEHGEEVQISRGDAYLLSQKFDGIGSDSGSTLEGGTKAAKQGLVNEELFPYVANYGQLKSKFREIEANRPPAEQLYRLDGVTTIPNEQAMYDFLSTWSGVVQIGIMWGVPDSWEITSYRSSGGGHAVLFAGYLKRDGWPNNRGYLLKNSWGGSWGQNGWGLVHPNVVTQMISARWSVFVGRSAPKTPRPRPSGDL